MLCFDAPGPNRHRVFERIAPQLLAEARNDAPVLSALSFALTPQRLN